MVTVYVFLGLLAGAAILLIVKLLRRGNSRTENAEGLLIEQQSRIQAHSDRVSFGTFAAHNAPPTMTDQHRH
uniref:Secreted protein n=1 Tax=Streptomyces sp. NBC_00003 TaxID=2903608 RepID=A0AAU2UY84_9ACTN